ncbi:hypothetical protein SAMN05216511_0107 [Streptomyces sp. KS_16]|nr:hypothetical protein BX261_7145 [Streptomyces sp. 2321.6]SDQ64446.1 hypothetical protein SAMN05216511_0107 [Streptomyces sp. KS_16]SEE16673.1 hypothetical protein SAMN05428940_7168 [Streptomyces sp. 2133.1]SNC74193.1 hypothetical protein SAMN06272741_7074 [Streptomyces sp. 2114.4]
MMSDVDGPCGAVLVVGTTGQQGRKCLGTYPHEMNTCESSAHLEWWANPSTCLARLPVRLTPVLGDTAWNAVVSPAFDDDAAVSLQLLIDAGPFFTLRFEDDSTTEVEAAHSGDVHCLRLSAAPSPGSGA